MRSATAVLPNDLQIWAHLQTKSKLIWKWDSANCGIESPSLFLWDVKELHLLKRTESSDHLQILQCKLFKLQYACKTFSVMRPSRLCSIKGLRQDSSPLPRRSRTCASWAIDRGIYTNVPVTLLTLVDDLSAPVRSLIVGYIHKSLSFGVSFLAYCSQLLI